MKIKDIGHLKSLPNGTLLRSLPTGQVYMTASYYHEPDTPHHLAIMGSDKTVKITPEDLPPDLHMVWAPIEQSNLMDHTRRELELIGEEEGIIEDLLDIVGVFVRQGHSGFSASYFIHTLSKVLNFQNISVLDDNPEHWRELGSLGGPHWQSKRNSNCFSTDGLKSYYDLDETKWVRVWYAPWRKRRQKTFHRLPSHKRVRSA